MTPNGPALRRPVLLLGAAALALAGCRHPPPGIVGRYAGTADETFDATGLLVSESGVPAPHPFHGSGSAAFVIEQEPGGDTRAYLGERCWVLVEPPTPGTIVLHLQESSCELSVGNWHQRVSPLGEARLGADGNSIHVDVQADLPGHAGAWHWTFQGTRAH